MFDELQLLTDNTELLRLLTHYAQAGNPDREAWHQRVSQLEGVSTEPMCSLHGLLLACDWIEQNTGVTSAEPGRVAGCYRVTTSGIRAIKQALLRSDDDGQ
jgi:hypothetical protein